MIHFNNFIKKNKNKVKYFKGGDNFLIVDRDRLYQSMYLSIFALALNKKKKINPLLLLDNSQNKNISKIYKSFGITKQQKIFTTNDLFFDLVIFCKTFIYSFLNIIKIKVYGFEWFVKELKIENIIIGDLVYDTYIRHDHSYIDLKINIKFIKILITSIFRTLKMKKIILKNNIKYVVNQSNTYSYNSGISTRVGVALNKVVYFQEENHLTIYSEKTIKRGKFVIRNEYFNKIKDKINIKKEKSFFKNRMNGKSSKVHLNTFDGTGVKSSDILYSNRFKKIYTKRKLIETLKCQKEYKKIILLGAHAYSDAPHSMGTDFVFMDYYSKLKETLEFIVKNDNENLWIIKPHPMEKFYRETKINKELFNKYKKHNIKICPKDINTKNILNLVDCVVTGRGTIGIEAACYGLTAITAGSNPYSGNDLVTECISKKNYFKELSNLNDIKKLKQNKIDLAMKKIFFIENFKPIFTDSNVIPSRKNYNKPKSFSNFFKELNMNLKIKNFEEDIFFKELNHFL